MTTLSSLGMLLIINIIIIAFYLLAPLNPKLALFAALLLTLNYIFYRLFKTKADNDLSKLENGVSKREVSKGIKLLRYAACSLAFVSFITTAQGMSQFVFKGVEWQAYLASFAVQSILIIFSFLFFHFYVKINSKGSNFPLRISRFVTYCVVLLFTLSLIVSTTFSFVYIANNTYASMRAKNSNIIIEGFFSKEIARLWSVNEEIGKVDKEIIEEDVKELADELSKAVAEIEPESEKTLRIVVKANKKIMGSRYIRDPNANNEVDSFFTQSELDYEVANNTAKDAEEYKKAYIQFKMVKIVYDAIYTEYKQRFNKYNEMNDESTVLRSYTAKELQLEVQTLNNLLKQIEDEYEAIKKIKESSLDKWLEPYRTNANNAFNRLEIDINALINFYTIFIPALEQCSTEIETTKENKTIISDLYSLVSANEYNEEAATNVQKYLDKKRADMALSNTENDLSKWIQFTQSFNSFIEYSKRKKEIDDFSKSNLSISYYILEEGDEHPNDVGNIKYVSEEQWRQARKEDFVQFVSLLKMLPDLELVFKQIESLRKDGKNVSSDVIEKYEPSDVLDSAYRYNRDLLEEINNIEKAFNYFKYDFKTMAIFSLALALFMDFASFLTGCFMFSTTFFYKQGNNKPQTRKE